MSESGCYVIMPKKIIIEITSQMEAFNNELELNSDYRTGYTAEVLKKYIDDISHFSDILSDHRFISEIREINGARDASSL